MGAQQKKGTRPILPSRPHWASTDLGPGGVDSGTGGAASDSLPLMVVALMALGVLALAAPVAANARKRS